MPTTFAIVVMVLMVVAVVVGLVLWARQVQRRSSDAKRHIGTEAPFDAEAAASRQHNQPGWP